MQDPDVYATGLVQQIHWNNLWFFAGDEDLTRLWKPRSRKVLSVRITSIDSDPATDKVGSDSWRFTRYKINDMFPLDHGDLVSFVKKSYHKDFVKNVKDGIHVGKADLQIIGPSKRPYVKPKDLDRMPLDLRHRFNLEKRASHYDYARLHPANEIWKCLYPEKTEKENND